jgi:hypothetical protein
MPTPGERRALLFVASVAALGVAVRGWKEFHPQDSSALAGDRTALARQIEAVDSAIATTSSPRPPRAPRAPGAPRAQPPRAEPSPRASRTQAPRSAPAPRASSGRARQPASSDTQPRDPRQSYWDRSLHFDSVRQAMELDGQPSSAVRRLPSHPPSAVRRLPSDRPSAIRRLPSAEAMPPVDLDVAGTDEAAAIPLIGPAMARRIVADRIENGPFGSLTGLERVQGITAAFARRLAPFVTFSRPPRLGSAAERRSQSKKPAPPGGESHP